MATRTMQEALHVAAIARQLREAEMGDARQWAADVRACDGAAGNEHASECARRLVAQHVARARKWNRQLVIAQRAIRAAMLARRIRHRGWRLARAAQAVLP